MKVFISSDIEGITSVVKWWGQHERNREEMSCERMTEETNAAIEGALEAGATAITVADSHGKMRNIIPEKLHPKARLVRGTSRPLSMMQGISKQFDAAFLIGYHAMAGTPCAALAHTYTGSVHHLWVNGIELGEGGFNARVAGQFRVPVILFAGDDAACAQAKVQIPGVDTVAVKQSIGYLAAENDHPFLAQERIKRAAKKALESLNTKKPVIVRGKPRVRIEFKHVMQADCACTAPTLKRLDGYTVEFAAKDMVEAMGTMRAAMSLAGTAKW
jgi:D-amino peptidase